MAENLLFQAPVQGTGAVQSNKIKHLLPRSSQCNGGRTPTNRYSQPNVPKGYRNLEKSWKAFGGGSIWAKSEFTSRTKWDMAYQWMEYQVSMQNGESDDGLFREL